MATSRLTLRDLQFSRFPNTLGYAASDVGQIAKAANDVQERLITAAEIRDEGWYGSYAEMAFNISRTAPNLTLPRGVARLIKVDVCDRPVPIRNQFYEYLDFGNGRWPKVACGSTANVCGTGPRNAFKRSIVPTFYDLPATSGYTLRFTIGDAGDVGKRMLVGCADVFGQTVWTLDSGLNTNGVFVSLGQPFVDLSLPGTTAQLEISAIAAIQKDITIAPVNVYAVNLADASQTLLLTMEPGERIAAYARYYFNNLPTACCPVPGQTAQTVQVTAMVKLDLVPVAVPTDYLLIQSKQAMIAEAESMRLGDTDGNDAEAKAIAKHREAIRYLQGQLTHYEGMETAAVEFSPFGTGRLSKYGIGRMM